MATDGNDRIAAKVKSASIDEVIGNVRRFYIKMPFLIGTVEAMAGGYEYSAETCKNAGADYARMSEEDRLRLKYYALLVLEAGKPEPSRTSSGSS